MIKSVLWMVLLITVIVVFVPLSPRMPKSGIDSSWMYGLNQATFQKLIFGKEVIFTFGPYASIYTKTYHPSTDFMMVAGSLYLALSYGACFIFVMCRAQGVWILAYCVTLAGVLGYWQDSLFLSFPLLAGLAVFKILFEEQGQWAKNESSPLVVSLLFAPFGLLVLVKGNLLILCGMTVALCATLFIIRKQKLLAAICIFLPLFSIIFFWIASGQQAAFLPDYFISMVPMVSGYTEAMGLQGNLWEVGMYFLVTIFLLRTVFIQSHLAISSRIFLGLVYLLFLFTAFKTGFVRHDAHAIIAGESILIAALLLPGFCRIGIVLPVVLASLACYYIDNNYTHLSAMNVGTNFKSTYVEAWRGFTNRMESKNWPESMFNAAIWSLGKQGAIPVLQGTTDIYSFNQTYLIASGNSWSPRPVFQSYSAYTPELAELNRKHLLGSRAPDNIVFRIESIDGRIPSIDDGASWPILLLDYALVQKDENFLLLQKKGFAGVAEDELKLTSGKHVFGENVALPRSSRPIFARIEIEPTVIGRMATILFKPSQLQITLELNDGTRKHYRIISGMAKSGFVISPLIENIAEFSMLYEKGGALDNKQVRSMLIEPRDGGSIFWNNEYAVTFSQVGPGS